MQDVKYSKGKLVCRVDELSQLVEIVHKGIATTIRFSPEGQVEIINTVVKVA